MASRLGVDPGAKLDPRLVRRVQPAMGTVVSIHAAPCGLSDQRVREAIDAAMATIDDLEARFSPWRPESEVSRLASGALVEADASADLRWVLGVCDYLAVITEGRFDARRHRADGRFDPSALVKGWIVDEAARHLDDAGIRSYAINAGGDVLARGEPATGRGWRIGIRHPDGVDRVAAVLEVRDLAVATSGLYERGGHIRDPRRGDVPVGLRSLTVTGPSLAFADAYATAGFVMGRDGVAWVAGRPGHEALGITIDDRVLSTAGMATLLSRSSHGAAVS